MVQNTMGQLNLMQMYQLILYVGIFLSIERVPNKSSRKGTELGLKHSN
jgi:hypothetical protein